MNRFGTIFPKKTAEEIDRDPAYRRVMREMKPLRELLEPPLTAEERDFLERVRDGRVLKPADRPQDRVRQSCRRRGFAEVATNPRRWVITPAGRAALEKDPRE